MRRDMDLARQILLDLEAAGWQPRYEIRIEGREPAEIGYHVQLLADAGLILAFDCRHSEDPHAWHPVRLTWEGHEFLEASRDEGRWQQVKRAVKDKTGGLSFEVVKQVLIKAALAATLGA